MDSIMDIEPIDMTDLLDKFQQFDIHGMDFAYLDDFMSDDDFF